MVSISNIIFEKKLYNLLISENETDSRIFTAADMKKNQFIKDGILHMELVMFLKPIINGNGNYYIEARTRNLKRTDIVIDYKGIQSVLELKIWHGKEYNQRGENQLIEYLDYYHLKKGYMLSFNFNKNKQTGIRQIVLGDKLLIEAIV